MPPAQPLRNTPGLVGLEGGSRRVNNNARLPDELREIVLHATGTADALETSSTLHEATVTLLALTHASCESIETALGGLGGVVRDTIRVNVVTSKVTFQFDAAKLVESAIVRTFENIGYGVEEIYIERKLAKRSGSAQIKASQATLRNSDKLHKATFELSGLTCASCVAAIETALSKLDGVLRETVNVNLLMSTATLQFDASRIDEQAIKQTIENAGYNVEDVQVERVKVNLKRQAHLRNNPSKASLHRSGKENVTLHIATFKLSRLECAKCVTAVETALRGLDGVLHDTVSVNPSTCTATLQFDASKIDEQTIKRAIENSRHSEDDQGEKTRAYLEANLRDSNEESDKLHKAIFELSGLTCASCVAAIETALRGLDGVLHDTVSVNLLMSTATLQFDASKIDEQAIKQTIENAGYNVEDVQVERVKVKNKRQRHPRVKPSKASLHNSDTENDKLHKATFELSGLTCASCVAAIETALRGLDGVSHDTVSVNLLMSTATLQFDASKINEQAIKQTIENAGYNVDDVQVERVRVKNKRQRQLRAKPSEATLHSPDAESDKLHKANFELSGLTCASCVAAIETALRGLDGVLHDTVSVNLLMSTATLQFDASKIDEKAIKQTIENAGYGVDAVRVEKAHDKRQLRLRPSAMTLGSSGNLSDDDYSPTVASVKMVTTKLTISGFTDALWVIKIQDEINGVPGIESAQIDSVLGEATIRHDLNLVGPRDIIEKIQQLGCDAQLASAHPSKQNTIRERAKRHEQKLRWRFLLSFIAAVPTFIISMIIMMWLPKMNPVRMAFHYEIVPGLDVTTLVLFVIATFVQFYLGAPFYVKAYRAMYYAHVANMETLVAIGTTCAYAGSTANVILAMANRNTSDGQQFYETSIFLIMFILLGKWLEALAKGKTYETITKLMELQPEKATLVNFAYDKEHGEIETEREIDLALVQVGDILKVNAGARIPCDGKIYRGRTAVDESMITGESIPVGKTTGDEVISATVNATSTVWITATRVGSDTTLSRIITLVQEAQASKKAPIEVMADKISQYFVPAVILIAIVTFIVWISLGAAKAFPEHWIPEYSSYQVFALFFAIAVVSIACPCAMGLASPTAIMVGTGLAARYGILIKGGGEAIQMASRLTTVAFDKTGTLTHGKPKVVYADLQVWNAPEISDESRRLLLQIIGVVESSSDHPLARAIVEYSIAELRPNVEKKKTANENDDGTSVANSFSGVRLESITEVPGQGVQAVVTVNRSTDPAGLLPPPPEPSTATVGRAAYNVYIGSKRWVRKQNGHTFPAHVTKEDVKNTLKRWRGAGCSIVCVGLSRASLDTGESKEHAGLVVAQFGIADTARPDAAATVATLKSMSIDVWMITGDHPVTAKAVAMQLGIKNVLAQVTPGEKSDMVKWLQQRGAKRGTKHEARAVVAMIGDGINDSPALAQADLGISIANATDIAMESASVILTRSTLLSLITLLRLSKAIIKRIKINFFWAFIYNSLAIPIAAGVFFPVFGIGLPPPAAGLAMAFSSVSVVLSSLMLRRFKEWRTTQNL